MNAKLKKLKSELKKYNACDDIYEYFVCVSDEIVRADKIKSSQGEAIISYVKEAVNLGLNTSDFFKNDSESSSAFLKLKSKMSKNFPNDQIGKALFNAIKDLDEIKRTKSKRVPQLEQEIKATSLGEFYLPVYNEEIKIKKAFKSENISNIDELNTLCKKNENKKTELMIINIKPERAQFGVAGINIDHDLASVMQMRAKICSEKGNKLVIMSLAKFENIIKNNENINIKGVTKISFLHHSGYDSRLEVKFNYVNNISNYINHLPDLKEIVLRGCGTASKPKDRLPEYTAKKRKDDYDETPSVQKSQLALQQKEIEDGKILTKASWRAKNSENKQTLHEIETELLPLIKGKFPSDEELNVLEEIPGMPPLKHTSKYVKPLKKNFFDPDKQISKEEKSKTKKVVRRARTEERVSTQNDMLSQVLNNMTNEQKDKISVKAYVGGYSMYQGRVIPDKDHGYGTAPKAVRIGPKPKNIAPKAPNSSKKGKDFKANYQKKVIGETETNEKMNNDSDYQP